MTGLGAIPIGSSTAFLDLAGSFIILTTVSYAIPFACNVLTNRQHLPKGPFHLGKWGNAINITAVVLITFFNIFYCFREYYIYRGCFLSCLVYFLPRYQRPYRVKGDHADNSTIPTAYGIPTTAEAMNYNSVILVGIIILTAASWFFHGRTNFPGPKAMLLHIHEGRAVEAPLEAGGLNTDEKKC